MEKKTIVSRIGSAYNHLEEYLLVGSLAANVLLVFVQVIMRTVFKHSLTWSEELSRYIFIWQIWLGTSMALKYREHIRVTLIFSFLKNKKIQGAISLFTDVIWFLFCAFLVDNGIELLISMASRNTVSSGLGLPLVYVYVVFPLASFLVCIRLLGAIKRDVMKLLGRGEDPDAVTQENGEKGGDAA